MYSQSPKLFRIFAWLMLCSTSMGVGASDPNKIAAEIIEIEQLASRVKVPSSMDVEIIIVRCGAGILHNRTTVPYNCFRTGSKDQDPFILAIKSAFRRLPVTPASVGEKTVDSWINFSVVFLRATNSVEIYPSLLYNDPNELTPLYSAPQRLLKEHSPRSCNNKIAWPTVKVDIKGTPVISDSLPENESNCERRSRHILEKSDFIPATFDGSPIEALYREPFSRGLLKSKDMENPAVRSRLITG